ncbi:hypothetical protein HK098_002648 [Nowakowskiella sp. JEL0407]|nr:hypothetical protein HK098_002648 [Nowakowskiella sp. JEL0407]
MSNSSQNPQTTTEAHAWSSTQQRNYLLRPENEDLLARTIARVVGLKYLTVEKNFDVRIAKCNDNGT